jgi:hypothetical protein
MTVPSSETLDPAQSGETELPLHVQFVLQYILYEIRVCKYPTC